MMGALLARGERAIGKNDGLQIDHSLDRLNTPGEYRTYHGLYAHAHYTTLGPLHLATLTSAQCEAHNARAAARCTSAQRSRTPDTAAITGNV